MASNLRLSSLIPGGLIVDDFAKSETAIMVCARSRVSDHACPLCGTRSSRVPRYVRTAADLPLHRQENRAPARGTTFCLQRTLVSATDFR